MYLTLKAFHIVAVIAWMAGMLYLPRLFVYHSNSKQGSEQSETFKVMEQRLLNFIMTPAMIVTWLLGIVLVLAMTVLHGVFSHWVKEFAFDRNRHRPKFYRIINEIPTVLLILIVVLAVVKPF